MITREKIAKGLYRINGSSLADEIIVEHDSETRKWYAYSAPKGDCVVDCEDTLRELMAKL